MQLHVCGCSAVLAHMLLNERLNVFGVLGCILCISGSLAIVLHAPAERPLTSVLQIWQLALKPCGYTVALLAFRCCVGDGRAACRMAFHVNPVLQHAFDT